MKRKIKNLSYEIFKKLSILLYGKIDTRRYLDHFDLLPTKITNSILVLGINPSSADLTRGREPDNCYVHYVYSELKNKSPEIQRVTDRWNHGRNGKRFCYPSYFNRIYNLFNAVSFFPLYVSREYNDKWIPKAANIGNDDKRTLRKFENDSISNFIIIHDLIPIKETDSKKVFSALQKNPCIVDKLNELLELKMRYLNPKLTIIFLKQADDYFLHTLNKVSSEIVVYPFIKYLSAEKYQKIKKEIKTRIGPEFTLSSKTSKWDYVN